MRLPTEFGVGAGEVPRGERGRRESSPAQGTDGDAFGEGVGVGAGGVAAAADAEDIEALGLRQEFRAAADGADFEGGDGDRDVEVAVLHLGGRDGVRALDDLRLVLPGGEEHRGDDVGDVGVEPEARGLRGADQVLACVEFRDRFGRGVQAFFDDLARDSNVGGDAPAAPSTALMAAGFLSEQRLPEGATGRQAVSASTTPQTASVAMVAMFIPIASLVS